MYPLPLSMPDFIRIASAVLYPFCTLRSTSLAALYSVPCNMRYDSQDASLSVTASISALTISAVIRSTSSSPSEEYSPVLCTIAGAGAGAALLLGEEDAPSILLAISWPFAITSRSGGAKKSTSSSPSAE